MTKNAAYILEIINHSDSHLTAEQIHQQLKEENKSVAQATVYNNLSSLYQQGMIRKISVEGHPDRYDKMRRHDHLVCRNCGKLSDILLEDLTEQIQKQVSIPMISYDLKVNYICDECRQKMQNT
ncbi:transcriptional repressor [Lachnospiraceae bacterium JLR.KK009]|jgi:Fe2+ or Zn2+ uptake regulation protein|nr:hypothetical protein C810_01851 [Lachnospiraceae bacterium A2]MCI8883644.1 transcriptional repressor [Lachnospiraceae bacterium]